VYSFYVPSGRDVSDIQVYIILVVVAYFILLYSVQCSKNSADCYMFTLTAVRDGVKLSAVESCVCWSGKITDIFWGICAFIFILRILILWCGSAVREFRSFAQAHGRQTLFHNQLEKAALQGCAVIEMFRVMTSVIVWFSEHHTVRWLSSSFGTKGLIHIYLIPKIGLSWGVVRKIKPSIRRNNCKCNFFFKERRRRLCRFWRRRQQLPLMCHVLTFWLQNECGQL